MRYGSSASYAPARRHQRRFNVIAIRGRSGRCKALDLPEERVHNNIQEYGNTTSATLPLAFHEARAAGKAPEGALVAFTALGAGLHWGSVLMRV